MAALDEGPLYAQLERALRARIESGEFKHGDVLPSEEAVGREYRVSRITVRRAIENLCNELVLERRHGVGTFVSASQNVLQSIRLRGCLDDVLAFDRHLRFSLVRQGRIVPPAEIAQAFALTECPPLPTAEVVARLDHEPFMYGECYFLPELIPTLRARDFNGREQPTLKVLTRAGIAIERGVQTMAAVVSSSSVASGLELTAGTPVIQVIRTYLAAGDRPVAVIRGWYHPANYRLSVDLLPRRSATRRALAAR